MSERPEQRRIRIVLLDEHVLFRESLARLLASEADFEIVAECAAHTEALKFLRVSAVDVVLVDIGLARDFIVGARNVRYPGKFLVIARDADASTSAQVLRCGASGVFHDSDSAAWLLQAIRLVANGEAWVDHKVIQLLAERYPHAEEQWTGALTDREQTVLQGVIDGLSNRSIGARSGVSESRIKATVQRLFKKAGVRTRSQLVRFALEIPRESGALAKPGMISALGPLMP
jgi:two-component system, NarL family, nitrate/nitrite response regulator NarL